LSATAKLHAHAICESLWIVTKVTCTMLVPWICDENYNREIFRSR